VGTNTEWGQLMANVSEDNGEETPLQVILFKDGAYFWMHKYWGLFSYYGFGTF
jgi:hypothetical protein